MVKAEAASTEPARTTPAELGVRVAFVGLLGVAVVGPVMSSSGLSYPAIANAWVALPLSGLLLAGLVDVRRTRRRIVSVDLLALCSLIASGALAAGHHFVLAAIVPYPPLVYLALRMLWIARPSSGRQAGQAPYRPAVPGAWLACACVVLVGVHGNSAFNGVGTVDVGEAGVQGGLAIAKGRPVYGIDRAAAARLGHDPHLDTYGPVNYEAYAPFAAVVAPHRQAARLATLAFDLVTALLLLVLGARRRPAGSGIRLAFGWLAVPLTLYSDSVSFNDALVAATLVGTLLSLDRPGRRGAAAALAAWTKFTPLALVPLVLVSGRGAPDRRAIAWCAGGFLVTSAIAFAPVLVHDSAHTILSRTFGFQAGRDGSFSIWALFAGAIHFPHPYWATVASKVIHGLLLAGTVGLGLALARLRLRRDVVGVAAASAGLTILVVIGLSYLSVGYALWFLPLVLIAVLPDSGAGAGAVQND